MNDEQDDEVEVECRVETTTAKALLIDTGKTVPGTKRAALDWVPRSMVSDHSGPSVEQATSIFLPRWFAEKQGLV